jgi:hypothetical protein
VNGGWFDINYSIGNDTMTKSDLVERVTENEAREALAVARLALIKALGELDLYLHKFDSAGDAHQKAQVINWALHYLSTDLLPSLRVDMLANAQARLSRQAG